MFATRTPTLRPAFAAASRRVAMRSSPQDKMKEAVENVAERADMAGANDSELMKDTPPPAVTDVADKTKMDVPTSPHQFSMWTRTQELINGRAAMVGFVAAITSEVITHQGTLSQIVGKVVDGDVVEGARGASWFGWGAVIVLLTIASLVPRLLKNEQPEDRQYSIWQAKAEVINGRVAMIGFLALLATEGLMGASPLF